MTRVLYHLGMPKTGTTLLQSTLASIKDDLRARGVLYPRAGRAGVAHHRLTHVLREGDADARKAFLAALADEVAAARAAGPDLRVVLLSSEGMVNLCGPETALGLAEFTLNPGAGLHGSAVIFLREMTSFLESMFFQTTRFRSDARSFAQYLGPHHRWMRNFLSGLTIFKARMGDAFEIVHAGKGYDVLREFEARLSLPSGYLDAPSRNVVPTARPSLKSQTALVHLDWLEAEAGFAIDRKAFSARLARGGVFAQDVAKFTAYAPGQRAEVAAIYSAIIAEAGFAEYAALSQSLPAETVPHHVIERALLTPDDVATVRAMRAEIELRPETIARRKVRQRAG